MKYQEKSFSIPEIEVLLTNSPNYRALREDHWRRLLRDMMAGRWMSTGVPLLLDHAGLLMDGQHRMRATLEYQKKTGHSIRFLVVSGVERSSESVIDGGAKRTIGHYLNSRKVRYATSVGALLGVEAKFQASGKGVLSANAFQSGGGASTSAMVEVFEANEKAITEWCQRAYPAGHAVGSPGLICAVTWFIARKNQERCEEFVDQIETGAGLQKHDPILTLRNFMLKLRGKQAHATIRRHVLAAHVIKAWNAWINDAEMRICRWRQFGENPEAFPEIDAGPIWQQELA